MAGRGRGGGHGRGVRCVRCGSMQPLSRENLKAKGQGGFVCKKCKGGKRKRQRVSNY